MNKQFATHTSFGSVRLLHVAVATAIAALAFAQVDGVAAQSSQPGGGSGSGSGAGGSGSGSGGLGGSSGGSGAMTDPQALIDFYLPRSMLEQSNNFMTSVIADPVQWQGQYMDPEPQKMKERAAEFLTLYPRALLPGPGESILGSLADPGLWQVLSQIGVTLIHPVAFEEAGQLSGREYVSSIDGGFDRVSLVPDESLGTLEDVQAMVSQAQSHNAVVAGDIIPLHTGRGYDFRLAEMNYGLYPGIYNMIEIPQAQWSMLPAVEDPWGFAIIHNNEAQPLIDMGLLPGRFDVLLGREDSADWSGWAATGEVEGVDGMSHRWAYAHLFKPEQPALNWADPTYGGRRVQAGDIVRHVVDYGTVINRLDAVPFLGLEPSDDSDDIDVFTTPLAINGTDDLAFMHRKLGGWTWVELNVPTTEYQRYMEFGPDIGYDFFTRAQTVHPLLNADARILRVAHRSLLESGVDHTRLIHAMQNHDEIAYQLINLRAQDEVQYGDETLSGSELADRILNEMQTQAAGGAAPYNALYRPSNNGVATTYAAYIAPALGIDPYHATTDEVETIKKAHVMLGVVNAMQPGIFAISQWDLVGALPVDRVLVADRIAEGDFRWLNRGAVDLMGDSMLTTSALGLPKAQTLYAPLPQQLGDPNSFASNIMRIIDARKRYRIGFSTAVAAPDVEAQSVFALLMRLPDEVGGVAVTAANYGQSPEMVTVDLSSLSSGSASIEGTPHDIVSDQDRGTLSGNELSFSIPGLTGVTIVIGATPR